MMRALIIALLVLRPTWPVQAETSCVETKAVAVLTILRDTVGIETDAQLNAVPDLVRSLCDSNHEEAVRATAAAFERLCGDLPCRSRGL